MIQWPHLGLFGQFSNCQADLIAKLNQNMFILDAFAQGTFLGFLPSEDDLPVEPNNSDIYILEDTKEIAIYKEDEWVLIESQEGWRLFSKDDQFFYYFDGSNWVQYDKDFVKNTGTSTDNAIARFDGITGKVIQNSVTTLNDDGDADGFRDVNLDNLKSSEQIIDTPLAGDPLDPKTLPVLDSLQVHVMPETLLDVLDDIETPLRSGSEIHTLTNKTGNDVAVVNGARIVTGTGKDLKWKPESTLIVRYSDTDDCWYIVGGTGSGEGGGSLYNFFENPSFEEDGNVDGWNSTNTLTYTQEDTDLLITPKNKFCGKFEQEASSILAFEKTLGSEFDGVKLQFSGYIKSDVDISIYANGGAVGFFVKGGSGWQKFYCEANAVVGANGAAIVNADAAEILLDELYYGPKIEENPSDTLNRPSDNYLVRGETSNGPNFADGTFESIPSGSVSTHILNAQGWKRQTTALTLDSNKYPTSTPTFSSLQSKYTVEEGTVNKITGNKYLRWQEGYVASVLPSVFAAGTFLATPFININNSDKNNVIEWSFKFKPIDNGTMTPNYSGTSSNTFGVAIWDVANSVYIPTNTWAMSSNFSDSNEARGTFQASDSESYVLIIYVANQSGDGGYANANIYFDDFYFGKQQPEARGAFVSNWIPYTPTLTGFGTPTNVVAHYQIDGPNVRVKGSFSSGTPSASVASISLPITSKTLSTNTILEGSMTRSAGSSAYGKDHVLLLMTASNSVVNIGVREGSSAEDPKYARNGNQIIGGSGQELHFNFCYEGLGLSSNMVLSSAYEGRSLVAAVKKSSTQAITNGAKVTFQTVLKNDGTMFNGTDSFVVKSNGDYELTLNGIEASGACFLSAYVNNVLFSRFVGSESGQTNSGAIVIPDLKVSDVVDIRSDASQTLSANAYATFVKLNPTSQTLAVPPKVFASYWLPASQAVTANTTPLLATSREVDTHNLYDTTTGNIKVPYPMTLRITVKCGPSAACTPAIYKNGTRVKNLGDSTNTFYNASSGCVSVIPTDVIQVRYSGSVTLSGNAGLNSAANWIEIESI